MSLLLLVACFCVSFACPVPAQTNIPGLPSGAKVIETQNLVSASRPNRELVLWMLKPSKYPSGYGASDLYACPDQTRGSYYSSPSRVSLLNSATRKIINTVNLAGANENGEDSVDLPYAIRKGYYYFFDGRESFAKTSE